MVPTATAMVAAVLLATRTASSGATGQAASSAVGRAGGCKTAADCNLNGLCTAGMCSCDAPWTGSSCGALGYAPVPAPGPGGADIFNASDPANTWGGPIVGPESDGKYHAFVPRYAAGALFGAKHILHGTANAITGPYSWHTMTDVFGGINPAYLVFPNKSDGNRMVYSLWLKGKIHVADSAAGPYRLLAGVSYPSGSNSNPAPMYHEGAFYITTQHTDTVWTRLSLDPGPDGTRSSDDPEAGWAEFGTISHDRVPPGVVPEDPYLFVDRRGNWHIINHAYDVNQTTHCGSSALSTHFFSADGKTWRCSEVQPYSHTVRYTDGSNHTYTTLERPNLHFNKNGTITHLVLAADLQTGDEGCAARPWPRKGPGPYGPTACTNCKYADHAGTIVLALGG